MPLEPDRHIAEFWQAVSRFSFRNGEFVWGSPAAGDAISDAEQLLAILVPATQLPSFRLDVPDQTRDDALDALRYLGDRGTVPIRLIRAQTAYLSRYRDERRRPVFPAGRYLESDSDREVVESFAIGLRLSLAAIGFSRVFRSTLTNADGDAGARAEADRLEDLARTRLTAAMVGMLRSFAVHTFDDDSPAGRRLRRLIAQEHRDEQAVLEELRSLFAGVRVGLYEEVQIGSRPTDRSHPRPCFECGWSWGVIEGAPEITVDRPGVGQRPGVAAPVPDLYFTWVALRSITELFSLRTRLLSLLDEDQQRLARALQLRQDLTLTYWSRLATFGEYRWPLEQLPWPCITGEASDYHSLLVTAITSAEVGTRTGNTDLAFGHLLRVFGRLATRHRIVRPPLPGGAPAAVRLTGRRILLASSTPGPAAAYRAADFAALLFDALVRAALRASNNQIRADLTALAELTWAYVSAGGEPRDRPAGLARFGCGPGPDWHNVLRLVDGMTGAVDLGAAAIGAAGQPFGFVHQLLADADDALDQLDGDGEDVRAQVERARRIVDEQPARACALLYLALARLDALLQPKEHA